MNEQSQGTPPQGQVPPSSGPTAWGPQIPVALPRRRGGAWTVIATVLLALSILGNVALLVLLVVAIGLAGSLGGAGAADGPDSLTERIIEKGPASAKIAVILVEGIIDESMVDDLADHITRAARDERVKAVILRVNSPGGGLTASDTLYHLLTSDLRGTKPLVAAMDSVGASGGYYVSCAADRIVAQPTCITGSIGVLAQLFFLRDLMKDKLGVTPVTLKMGDQKDWPNIFGDTTLTDEQRTYLMQTLLVPGYEKFVEVVRDARRMEDAEVRRLATGRIFLAPEARDVNLIDEVGYFERAVEVAMDLANLKEARLIEYRRPPRLSDLLGLGMEARQALDLRPEKLAGLATPKVMYLWTGF